MLDSWLEDAWAMMSRMSSFEEDNPANPHGPLLVDEGSSGPVSSEGFSFASPNGNSVEGNTGLEGAVVSESTALPLASTEVSVFWSFDDSGPS